MVPVRTAGGTCAAADSAATALPAAAVLMLPRFVSSVFPPLYFAFPACYVFLDASVQFGAAVSPYGQFTTWYTCNVLGIFTLLKKYCRA